MCEEIVLSHPKPPVRLSFPTLPLLSSITRHGVRNSLLLAPMPTASTAQILGNNESIEPYTSNIYSRRVLSGEFQVVNHHLLKDLTERNLWNEAMKQKLIAYNGSIQVFVETKCLCHYNAQRSYRRVCLMRQTNFSKHFNLPLSLSLSQLIEEIPDDLKQLYKTVWEISQRALIDMAADRGAFIDQSQSFNVHIAEPNFGKLTSMHFYAWKKVSEKCAWCIAVQ